ncbi:OmpA family protein [Litorimonas sp. RW-G-Af-16]|uniref:OmpA family protein n=1 Tax=Litorimonas sp. RW-G-Af-16 TaxID=3241168 RepID=UPI00390C5344
MGAKWVWGTIILAIASLILSWIFYVPKIASMENDIRGALAGAGYDFANVEMDGNIARLTGEAPSEAFARDAASIAENTECKACKGKRSWHVVDNQLSFTTLPTQSPYTFNAIKDDNGNVVLSGYVASQEQRDAVMAKATSTFDGTVTDRTIKIAMGAPDANWEKVIEKNIDELDLLDSGRFAMENYTNFISGEAASADVRARINQMGANMPEGYEFAANISVPDMAAENVGEVKSATICQTLFDDLNDGKKIFFQTDKAEIRGAESFDLLNTLASAANQCASFRIKVDGHTDNVGDAAYNMSLSEARANTVVAYLNQNDVELSRMTAKGFGETQPSAPNDTEEGRAANRRIVFTVTQSE